MANPLQDFWSGLSGNDQYEDPPQQTIDTGMGTYTSAKKPPAGPAQGVGDFMNQFLTGFTQGRQGGGGGGRQSTRDMLQERLGLKSKEDQQKQADWQQTYNQKNTAAAEATRLNNAKIAESQTNSDNIEKGREFNQARDAGADFNSGKWQVAGQAAPEDIQIKRGGNTNDPEDIGQYSTVHVNPTFADTQGRPSYTAGGVTQIPRSPQESADLAQQDKQNEFNGRLADVAKTNPQFVKDHQNDIAAFQLFGKIPAEKQGDFAQDLMKDALTNPDPVGRKKSEDTYKAMVNLKKGIEPDSDIKMRNPALQPWELDQSVMEGEPNTIKSIVQSLVNRDATVGSFSMKDPDWKRGIELAKQVDPSFNMSNYVIQQKTKGDYASGFRSRQTQSFRTVIDHLGDLEDTSKSLNNYNTQWENAAFQALKPKLPGGYPQLDKAKLAVGAVGAEMANTVKGANAAATDPEINNWLNKYDLTKPAAGLHASNQEGAHLMLARAAASQNNWEDTMGKPMPAPIFTRYYADKIDKLMDTPGYTQAFMNEHSRFKDDNTSIDSKGSVTGPNVPPTGSAPAKTAAPNSISFRSKSGAVKAFTDPAQIAKLRGDKDFTEIK